MRTNTLYLSANRFFQLAALGTDQVTQMSPVGSLDIGTDDRAASSASTSSGSHGFDQDTAIVGDSGALLVGENAGKPGGDASDRAANRRLGGGAHRSLQRGCVRRQPLLPPRYAPVGRLSEGGFGSPHYLWRDMPGIELVLGGSAKVYCVHDREKRLVEYPGRLLAHSSRRGHAAVSAHPKFQTCGCCENVFAVGR